ncbi:LOW QUALITY PROTEIN: sodium/hydrogen exchanger 11 [Suncus etruscus]|uniref:LOW QUALITY PROTEIN: sodium/hydrogen exchanger 11 n=1 Tax=Suncus etruscus TaxID=109475 RepID=UPI00210F858C|nr:LOW QUALITY PROTEIN: sodium/hydrogen exchanger 11 [Suncus etruscus]
MGSWQGNSPGAGVDTEPSSLLRNPENLHVHLTSEVAWWLRKLSWFCWSGEELGLRALLETQVEDNGLRKVPGPTGLTVQWSGRHDDSDDDDDDDDDDKWSLALWSPWLGETGFLRQYFRNSEAMVMLLLSSAGVVLGNVAYNLVEVHQVVYPLLKLPNFSLFCYFAPLIMFMAALDVDHLKNVLWQVILVGLINFFTALIVIVCVTVKFNKELWDLQSTLLFSIVISIIDPTSYFAFPSPGISKMHMDIISGESLVICGLITTLFGNFRRNIPNFYEFRGALKSSSSSLMHPLQHHAWPNVILCLSLVYMTFYIVEFWGMSGLVALMIIGLKLDSLSFNPKMESVFTKILMIFCFAYQHVIFTFFGIIIRCGEIIYLDFHVLSFIFILFLTVNFARLFTVVLVSPILSHLSYKYNWRWAMVIAWSGLKGAINLLLAPNIYKLAQEKVEEPQKFIFYIQVVILLTIGINTYKMIYLARSLGLCTISLSGQMVMQNVLGMHIQEIIKNIITLNKTKRLLSNIDWDLVEKIKIKHSIPAGDSMMPPLTDQMGPIEDILMEEARLQVAVIQMSSYKKQYHDRILFTEAGRKLIGATKAYCAKKGKFMNICDVLTYMRSRSWLVKFKKVLILLEYQKEKPPLYLFQKSKLMIFIYRIRFSENFEYVEHAIRLIYTYPLAVHLWPKTRELNVRALIKTNYFFVTFLIVESVLKVIILQKKYFQEYWHLLEFTIMILGVVDTCCVYLVHLQPDSWFLIQSAVILGYMRFLRLIPLIKILIPVLITMVDELIRKRGSLLYSITKGYIKAQDDTKYFIKYIFSQESVNQKLDEILKTNKLAAVQELEFIKSEFRDIGGALETRSAILTVLAKALKNLTFLGSRGFISKQECVGINKVLLSKIKDLNNFPMVIPPPTPDKYLHNIEWLENKEPLIDFFKQKAKIIYLEYGTIFCTEGEMPQGIYLIISGRAILHYSSAPSLGVTSKQRANRESETMFTEECTSGDIIGELSCLVKCENEYTAICDTSLQVCFISLEDLFEGFDVFWPSLEPKLWLKLCLSIAHKYIESSLVKVSDLGLSFQKCVQFNNAHVETLSRYNEIVIDRSSLKLAILVYGSAQDNLTKVDYFAPSILPNSCEQVQGTSEINKLLMIQDSKDPQDSNSSKVLSVGGDRLVSPGVVPTADNHQGKNPPRLGPRTSMANLWHVCQHLPSGPLQGSQSALLWHSWVSGSPETKRTSGYSASEEWWLEPLHTGKCGGRVPRSHVQRVHTCPCQLLLQYTFNPPDLSQVQGQGARHHSYLITSPEGNSWKCFLLEHAAGSFTSEHAAQFLIY